MWYRCQIDAVKPHGTGRARARRAVCKDSGESSLFEEHSAFNHIDKQQFFNWNNYAQAHPSRQIAGDARLVRHANRSRTANLAGHWTVAHERPRDCALRGVNCGSVATSYRIVDTASWFLS